MPHSRRVRAFIVGSILTLLVGLTSVQYTVRRGDTLGRIARDHGVSLSDVVAVNDISNPDLIYPGQVLAIPGVDTKPDITHVVTRGETLARIAGKYETSVNSIIGANSILNPNLILIGQQLLVPGSGSAGPGGSGSGGESSGPSRSGKSHIVKRGESLAQIASKYPGVSDDDIARANGIVNGLIYTGTRLFLDGPGLVAEGSAGEISYQVRTGDRLGDIAAKYGTMVSKLVELNGISNPNRIRAGQNLVIPTGIAWTCPVDGGRYFNDWGFPRGGGTRFHEGNDLFTTHGSPVRAPVGGTVEFVTGSIGGLQFRLYGDDGVKYIGSHMSSFGKDGKVRAGDIIGYVGNTGNATSTSPHLHFGMYLGNTVVNPYPTLVTHDC
ncbi:MAG TPA: LysM peptidoglycan-binding domain-containing M23 family metallopeptidase [Acidimicrobiia bacterium]|jgi:LysM repeat protein